MGLCDMGVFKKTSPTYVQNGLVLDDITRATMKELNLQMFKSCWFKDSTLSKDKIRYQDRAKAKKLWGEKVDLKNYNIHHLIKWGYVGLCPTVIHKSMHHYGGIDRFSKS